MADKIQGAGTSLAPKPPIQTIGEYLSLRQGDIKRALPKHMTADRLLQITMTLIEQTPRLLECSTASIVGGVLQAAQLGLEPGLLGECYLVPYRNNKRGIMEAQFQVGYRGYAKLALQSGQYSTFETHVVFERDGFDYSLGSQKFLRHKPYLGQDRGKAVAAYAIVETRDGKSQFEIMSLDDIEKVRRSSKAADDGPWVTWWEGMARKTPAKRLAKYLQLSPQLSRAVAADETTKTEIAEDMTNVVDATDWSYTETPTQAPQGDVLSDTSASASPQAAPSQPERQHYETPPRAGQKPISDKQKGLLIAKAKTAFGDEQYKTVLPAFLSAHNLPAVESLASNQASWVIDELQQTGAPVSQPQEQSQTRAKPRPSSGDGIWDAPAPKNYGDDEPVPF